MNRSPAALLLFVIVGAALAATAAVLVSNEFGREPDRDARSSFRIGLITNNPNGLLNVEGFQQGLRKLGYVEGDDLTYLFAGKPIPQDALQSTIRIMVAEGADLIFTAGSPTGVAAKEATVGSNVPVVFGVIADPVAAGVMTDLNRPGGNLTGVMLSQNQSRRLEMLSRVIPNAQRVFLPYNPDDPAPVSAVKQLESSAQAMGLTLVHAHARNGDEVSAMLADLPKDIDSIFMLPDSTVNLRADDLIKAASARNLPVSGPSTAQVLAGATLSYGIVHQEVGEQAARMADRILRGADPATMPVETADFYLTVNVAAATRIGLELSEELLQQADVILREDNLGK